MVFIMNKQEEQALVSQMTKYERKMYFKAKKEIIKCPVLIKKVSSLAVRFHCLFGKRQG